VILIPIISMVQDTMESVKITERLSELLQRLGAPIPCVIGTYLDAVPRKDIEHTRRLTALKFWEDEDKSNDVLLCSPVGSTSAKFVLHYIDNHASKPPFEDVWAEKSDARYGALKVDFEGLSVILNSLSSASGSLPLDMGWLKRKKTTRNTRQRGLLNSWWSPKKKVTSFRHSLLIIKPLWLRVLVNRLLPRRHAGSERYWGKRSCHSSRSIARRQRGY